MDPLSAAMAFGQVVGLIGQFRSERASAKQADFNDFLEWLVETNQAELKTLVERNAELTSGIQTLLTEQYEALLEKLESLDGALAHFASGLPGFADVAFALRPQSRISEQAWSILRQFEASGASKILKVKMDHGPALLYVDGRGRDVNIDDVRFLEDDLWTLVELRLLRTDYTSKGENLYVFTRAASDLVRVGNKGQ